MSHSPEASAKQLLTSKRRRSAQDRPDKTYIIPLETARYRSARVVIEEFGTAALLAILAVILAISMYGAMVVLKMPDTRSVSPIISSGGVLLLGAATIAAAVFMVRSLRRALYSLLDFIEVVTSREGTAFDIRDFPK